MTAAEFSVDEWIELLAHALPNLAEVQEPYLREYYKYNPRVYSNLGMRDDNTSTFALDDLRDLYAMAHHSHAFAKEKEYAVLCTALNPVRHILRSHPTLRRVLSPIVGEDDFWMQILGSGSLTSLTDLIAGLMVRAGELPGDGGLRLAVNELNTFLVAAEKDKITGVLGDLNVGYDMVLFHGLTLKQRIDIGGEMAVLPFDQVQAFLERRLVEELAPPGAGFNDWRSVVAVVRLFRWKPVFQRKGYERKLELGRPVPFFREAEIFLELLAVAHEVPLLCLAALPNCINRSASRLLGLEHHNGSFQRGRSAQDLNGFEVSPELVLEVLAEAKEAFNNRRRNRYETMAPVISRLAEALARGGQYAAEDKVLDVAIAFERMFKPKGRYISKQLQEKVAGFLGGDGEAQSQIRETMEHFYDVRSAIIHGPRDGKKRHLLEEKNEAFNAGFSLARRSLFKMLREGSPQQ